MEEQLSEFLIKTQGLESEKFKRKLEEKAESHDLLSTLFGSLLILLSFLGFFYVLNAEVSDTVKLAGFGFLSATATTGAAIARYTPHFPS